jgi:hypothetical protein
MPYQKKGNKMEQEKQLPLSSSSTEFIQDPDLKRFKGQKQDILECLLETNMLQDYFYHSKTELEQRTNSRRVASRINELREVYDIRTSRNEENTASYKLIGIRETPRIRSRHCKSCVCFN